MDLTFTLGGVVNRELYFGTLGGKGGPATGKAAELIHKSFGSFDAYKKDLKATGIAVRGWVWTGYDPQTGLLFNYIGDAQNTLPVWGVKPVLALDVYEQAYYADFYTARGAYIEEFMNCIDWGVVNALLAK